MRECTGGTRPNERHRQSSKYPTTQSKPHSQIYLYHRRWSLLPPSSGNNHYLSPVGHQPDDRRQFQRAQIRSVIAQLFASFAEESRGECTAVLDPSGDDRKARESKQERSVNKKKRPPFGANQMKVVRKIPGIVLLDFAQQYVAILRFARSDMRECVNTLDRMSDASKAQNSP